MTSADERVVADAVLAVEPVARSGQDLDNPHVVDILGNPGDSVKIARMKRLLAAAVIAVALLHQDVWLWGNKSLILGFLPAGLAYHMGYCLLASALMWALVRYAWPSRLDEEDDRS